MDKTDVTIAIGATETLIATILPEEAHSKTVQFISSNLQVATVTPVQGKVTGIAEGVTTITATTINGKTATSTITVTE
ncbi:Ig-like domain-containing protein [Enterococcus sp. AZ126]|uniref:Ig-like domain-containing protein n=1 Tax=Enterococcus sp. AZ126 TaxID=2774635 RepID=UPI003F689531